MLHKYFSQKHEYGRTYLEKNRDKRFKRTKIHLTCKVDVRWIESIGCDYPLESIHLYYYAKDEFSLFSVIDRLQCTI